MMTFDNSHFFSPNSDRGTRRALVVGIDDYLGDDRDLPSCVADASTFATLLQETFAFDEVCQLTNADASLATVQSALADLLDKVRPADRVVFFFSGHGARITRDDTLREALVLQDLRMLEDTTLVAATQNIPPGTFTLLLDSCFSGGLSKFFGGGAAKSLTPYATPSAHRYRPFGGSTRPAIGASLTGNKEPVIKAAGELAAEPVLNGLLLSACRETETAAASIPGSDGLSAFTFAFTSAIRVLGPEAPVSALMQRTTATLRELGALQAPQIREPPDPPGLSERALFDGGTFAPGADPLAVIAGTIASALETLRAGPFSTAALPAAARRF